MHIDSVILPRPPSNEEFVVNKVNYFSPVFLKFEIFVLNVRKVADVQTWLISLV